MASVVPDVDVPALLARLAARPHRITADSRQIVAGDAFAAFPGMKADGRSFIADALARGAGAVFWEPQGFQWSPDWHVAQLPVDGLQAKLGLIADFIYGSPSQALWTIGVTGTNGKTSCSRWIAQCLDRCGRRAAIIGTLGNGLVGAEEPARSRRRTPRSCRRCSPATRRRARSRSRWRCRRTASIRAASTASRSTSRCSRTSRATTSTITARWPRTARRKRSSSRGRGSTRR